MVTMNDKYYPYINEFVSFRLSEKKVQLRNLKKRVDTIVDLHGSAFPFIREFTGQSTVGQIFTKLYKSFDDIDAGTIRKDYSEVLERLLREDIVALSEQPVDKRRKGLEIIAPTIRSSVHFDITHKCNEQCIHCLVDKDNAEADMSAILDVLLQAARLGYTSFSFSGGEPSLHPEFIKILGAARDLGFFFTLFTNAMNLSGEAIKTIAAYYPDKARISLYSMKPEIHDQITKIPGSFERTLRGIRLFQEAGVRLYINIPVMTINYVGYRDVASFCDSNHFERNLDPVVQPTRDLRDRKMSLQLNYEQAKDVTGFQQSADVLVANVKDGDVVCNAGADPSIDARLNVYPCPGLRKSLGDLHTATLEALTMGHPLLAELQSLNLTKLDSCQACEYLNGCYRCHGHGYQDEGSIYGCSSSDKRQAKIRQQIMRERGTLNT